LAANVKKFSLKIAQFCKCVVSLPCETVSFLVLVLGYW